MTTEFDSRDPKTHGDAPLPVAGADGSASVLPSRPRCRPRRRPGRALTLAFATVLIFVGGAALVAGAVAPEQTERVYGQAKTTFIAIVDGVRATVLTQLPTVSLGLSGGIAELDGCDGAFTEMVSYRRQDVPPVWAAHNNCGGDAILPWEMGQRVRVDGLNGVYEVVDIRRIPKTWSSTDDLVGLRGELALQTCFYGEGTMKFVGLALAP